MDNKSVNDDKSIFENRELENICSQLSSICDKKKSGNLSQEEIKNLCSQIDLLPDLNSKKVLFENSSGRKCIATPIINWAARVGDTKIMGALINKIPANDRKEILNVWPDREGETPVCVASKNNNADIIELLYKEGANINVVGSRQDDMTALHVAVNNSNLKAVTKLLSLSADLKVLDVNELTPLEYAENAIKDHKNNPKKAEETIVIKKLIETEQQLRIDRKIAEEQQKLKANELAKLTNLNSNQIKKLGEYVNKEIKRLNTKLTTNNDKRYNEMHTLLSNMQTKIESKVVTQDEYESFKKGMQSYTKKTYSQEQNTKYKILYKIADKIRGATTSEKNFKKMDKDVIKER